MKPSSEKILFHTREWAGLTDLAYYLTQIKIEYTNSVGGYSSFGGHVFALKNPQRGTEDFSKNQQKKFSDFGF